MLIFILRVISLEPTDNKSKEVHEEEADYVTNSLRFYRSF